MKVTNNTLTMPASMKPPAEAEIRRALRTRLEAVNASAFDCAILEELGVCRGRVRIDVALVNGLIHGYEIKSDLDSLRRLSGQVEYYGKVLDQATLVVGGRHLSAARSMVPNWWGITRVARSQDAIRFTTVRKERRNPARDSRALVELLWLEDALAMLGSRGQARGLRGKPRRVLWDCICQIFDVNEIAAAVRARLKARKGSRDPREQS